MKVCVTEHRVPSFGTIPIGSLWADDSPYVLKKNAACFVDADDMPTVDVDAEEVSAR